MAQIKLSIITLFIIFASYVFAVIPLEVQGANFVSSTTGERFQIIGAAYQPGGASGFDPGSGVDPLSDAKVCMRDAILIQRLGANTIRVYNLDPDLDHTECANIFNAAGIYMILDVNSPLPNESLNRVAPWENYNSDYITRVLKVVDSFMNYNNTLGFFSANEIINEQSVAEVPQYVRAVTRDIKDYISKHSSRTIPVGYSAADVRPLLADTFSYFSCSLSNETSSKIDFFGLNSYSWCGDSSYQTSGYDTLVEDFSNTTIPVFFSEYGCNHILPRTFTEVGALYSSPMSGVFSGGLVYEYSQEPNDYGLVTINDNNTVSIRVDYDNFMSEANKIDVQALTAANGSATGLTPPTCSSSLITTNLTDSFEVPARPDGFDDLINNGVKGTSSGGSASISNVDEPDTIYDSQGNAMNGLKLNILANDQSNLPGNNTSGNSGTSTSGGSSPSGTANAAIKAGGLNMAMAVGVIGAGIFAHL